MARKKVCFEAGVLEAPPVQGLIARLSRDTTV